MVKDYQNGVIAQILEAIISQVNFDGEPISNIGDILLSILEKTPYDQEPKSVLAELFLKLKDKLEGRAFTPYDKEPKSVLAEILLSILNETEYTDPPTSRIGELLLELKAELESYAEITTSGPIANFTTSLIKPLVNLTAFIVAQQESGTPTSQSPKAINGVSSVTVTQADENMQAVVSKVINLGGTYYGGHFTQDKDGHRQFVVDRKLKTVDGSVGVTVASSLYIKSDACDGYINDDEIQPRTSAENQPDLLCNRLAQAKGNIWSVVGHADEFCIVNRSIHFNISNDTLGIVDYTQETTATAKAKIDEFLRSNPITVIIPITPYTIDLPDGEPIITLNGVNNIYNDSGDTSVTYLALISDNITRGAKMRAVKKAEKIKLVEQEKQPVIIDPIETKETKDTKAEG